MSGVPSWSAARSGLLGDPGAVDASAQVNQFLGSHGITAVYAGSSILAQNGAGLGFDPISFWSCHLDTFDYDQPFVMSGTSLGRVSVPVLPVGAGADLIVSLCPDSAGAPGVPITTTRLPASWITQLAAVCGAAGSSSQLQLATATAPLALPQFNPLMISSGFGFGWAPPAPTSAGPISSPVALSAGNYLVLVGGGATGGAAASNVYTVPWQGGSSLGPAVAQPSLPEPMNITALMANSTTLITAGGLATGSPAISSVYTAGWTPSTGQVSAWTSQTPLPQAVSAAFGAATDTACYVVGGVDGPGSNLLNTVYWAAVSNGQITSWNTGPPLPIALKGVFVAIVGGFLVAAGGYSTLDITTTSSAVFYAAINSDGSLSSWQTGPSMPYPVGNAASGDLVADAAGMTIIGGYNGTDFSTEIQNLSFGPTGPGTWSLATNAGPDGNGVFPLGAGQWQVFSLYPTSYATAVLYQVPALSVPLPTTGLTSGATYHITLRQAGGDLNNYLRTLLQDSPFGSSVTVQSRVRDGGAGWTGGTTGQGIPLDFFNQAAGGPILHTWEDSGARISTLVNTTTPDQTLLGVLEAVEQPAPVLNVNSSFTTGTAPWVAAGGTITQSSAQTHGGLPYSGLLSPSGTASTAQIESEKISVYQSHNYVASTWLYSPTGYADIAVNINWYNASGTLVSTTSGTVTALAANTWTAVTTTGAVPAGASTGTIVAVETGTPPATALLYIYAALQDTSGPMLASAAKIDYVTPDANQPPVAVGVTQLI